MFSPTELEQVVAKEQNEKARNNNSGPRFDDGRTDPRNAYQALRREALIAVQAKFHKLLDVMYSNNKQGMFVALPKLLSEDPFTGSPTIMTELINNYADRGGEKAYLLMELAQHEYHFSHVPSFKHMVDFIHNCEKVTNGELFWLFVLADELNVLTPEYKKMMDTCFFKNRELYLIDWVKPYTKPRDETPAKHAQQVSAEASIPDAQLLNCVIAQRELIEFFVKKLG